MMRTVVGTLGILVGFGTIAFSAFPMWLTFLGRAFESELGNPDLMSWLPWALVFDISFIVEGILGIVAGRLILRRSRAAVTTSFIVSGIAIVSIIPGYIFWQGTNANGWLFLYMVLAPAIFIGAVYTAIGQFARKDLTGRPRWR